MELDSLTAISPIDGRYRSKTKPLAPFFSEHALIQYRVRVEIEYFIALCEAGLPPLSMVSNPYFERLRVIWKQFSGESSKRIKEIEGTTNHDVKAVEYFIKEEFEKISPELASAQEFIHFGLTSQDINNTATPMMLRDALHEVLIPGYEQLLETLERQAAEWDNIPMLARTHGQPASPTYLGKEFKVFAVRLRKQLDSLKSLSFPAKFGGATGNMNAHMVAFPDMDWHHFADNFVSNYLGLDRSFPTTQIEHYDGLGTIFDNLKRINTVLTDLCIDCWLYISMDYFTQKTIAGEVGSSAMPHKVNPIDFENAEGNAGMANAIYEFLSRKLPVSRLQRDLTDSTLLRNSGTAFAHSFLVILSASKGLSKLRVNPDKIAADLDQNWAVLAEAIQTILRREGYPKPYEKLKELTRGNQGITESVIQSFIEGLDVSESVKAELRVLRPENYTGRAPSGLIER